MTAAASSNSVPLASVVIPAFNREAFIGKALEAMLRQTFRDFEVIVVDDGSGDRTLEVVEAFHREHPELLLRWVAHETNRGANHARNTGIRAARGKYVPIIDSDCIPEPSWLENIIRRFEEDPRVAAVTGWVESPPATTIYELVFKGELKIHGEVEAPRLAGCNMAFRRDVLLAHPLDEDLRYGCDEDGIYLRLRAMGYKQRRAPDATVTHHHPYRSLRQFIRQGRTHGWAAAWLVYKYYLPTRLDMLPFLLGYGSLLLVLLAIPLGWWRPWLLAVPAFFLLGAVAALAYNELFRKRKTVGETIRIFPMLLVFYHMKLYGYVENSLRLRMRPNAIKRIRLSRLPRVGEAAPTV